MSSPKSFIGDQSADSRLRGNDIRRNAFTIFLTFFLASTASVFAEDSSPVSFLTKAEESLKAGSKKKADFYVARYLASCQDTAQKGCSEENFQAFLKKRQLPPRAFLPASWNKGFLEWFEKASSRMWDVDQKLIREKHRSFEIARSTFEDKYFVTVAAYPELELWHVVDQGVVSKPMPLVMGSFRERPVIFFGKIVNKQFSFQFTQLPLDTQKRTLHSIWKPEFFDLDADGMPEVWLRYNITWGNGFSQILEIYKIKDERELRLLRRFQGTPDGIARRLEDGRVEVGGAISTQGIYGRENADKLHLETWQYKDKEFKKISEQDLAFILNTSDWVNYF